MVNSLQAKFRLKPIRSPWWRKAWLESKWEMRSTCSLSLFWEQCVCIWNHSLVCCLKRLLGVTFCHKILASGSDWSQWETSECIWGHSMTRPACFHSLYFYAMALLSRDNLNCKFTLKAICIGKLFFCFLSFSEQSLAFCHDFLSFWFIKLLVLRSQSIKIKTSIWKKK